MRVYLGISSVLFLSLLSATTQASLTVTASLVAGGTGSSLLDPNGIAFAPGDSTDLYITQQRDVLNSVNTGFDDTTASIKVLNLTTNTLSTFLTIPGVQASGNEQGLLDVAFDPNFQTNHEFYVRMISSTTSTPNVATNSVGVDTVRRYTLGATQAQTLASAQTVFSFTPHNNFHLGGWIGFSPKDGELYEAIGEEGTAANASTVLDAQSLSSTEHAGRIVRLDTTVANPTPVVVAYGLRNPWRDSFDRQTGDLYIGDVGQHTEEEVDYVSAARLAATAGSGPVNLGWPYYEGTILTPDDTGPTYAYPKPPSGFSSTAPIYEYDHEGSVAGTSFSILGGYVYRGSATPAADGTYFFADTITNRVGYADYDGTTFIGPTNLQGEHGSSPSIPVDSGSLQTLVSFGEDASGNLYAASLASGIHLDGPGEIYRFNISVPEPGSLGSLALMIVFVRHGRRSRGVGST